VDYRAAPPLSIGVANWRASGRAQAGHRLPHRATQAHGIGAQPLGHALQPGHRLGRRGLDGGDLPADFLRCPGCLAGQALHLLARLATWLACATWRAISATAAASCSDAAATVCTPEEASSTALRATAASRAAPSASLAMRLAEVSSAPVAR